MQVLLAIEGPKAPVLVAAGHDHSLQVHRTREGRFHVVSGAGSARKVDRVMELETSLMSIAAPGYMRLDSYGDGGLGLSVTAIEEHGPRVVFQTCLGGGNPDLQRLAASDRDLSGSSPRAPRAVRAEAPPHPDDRPKKR